MKEFDREDFLAFLENSGASTITDIGSKKGGCSGCGNSCGEHVEDTSTIDEVSKQLAKETIEDAQAVKNITLIERVIIKFLRKCERESSVPSVEQAYSITILDEINRKYTTPA